MSFFRGSVHNDFTSKPLHRFHGAPKKDRDYKSINGTIAPHDDQVVLWPKDRIPKGFSCFIPIELPHGHFGKAPAPGCAIISRLPTNWKAVYTGLMNLRLSDKSTTTAHHFHVYPTIEVTEAQFLEVVHTSVDWPWTVCSAVGAGFPSYLNIADSDDEDLEPLLQTIVYYLAVWYSLSNDITDQILMNDVYTWITTTKPDFEELSADFVRSSFIEHMIKSYPEDDDDPIGTILLYDILDKLRNGYSSTDRDVLYDISNQASCSQLQGSKLNSSTSNERSNEFNGGNDCHTPDANIYCDILCISDTKSQSEALKSSNDTLDATFPSSKLPEIVTGSPVVLPSIQEMEALLSNIINLKRIGCFVELFQREILPKDIDISDERHADDDDEMLSKGAALLDIFKSLEATNAVMSAVSASLAITLKNAPVCLSTQLCDMLNSDPHISDLFLACVSLKLPAPLALSVLGASVDEERSLSGDKRIHVTAFSTNKPLRSKGFQFCLSMSKSFNYFKDILYRSSSTTVRGMVTILNNRAGPNMFGVHPGTDDYDRCIREEILNALCLQYHLEQYEWGGERKLYRLPQQDRREFILLFSYDHSVHQLGEEILMKYTGRNRMCLKVEFSSSFSHSKMIFR